MKRDHMEIAFFSAFWKGRLQEIACALDRARVGPLPPLVLKELSEAFYAMNRAQVRMHEHERAELDRPRAPKARRKKGKR